MDIKDLIIFTFLGVVVMALGLMTVICYYQLRNQGSIGQPMRDLYKINLFLIMPVFTVLGAVSTIKGLSGAFLFFTPPISFYIAVVIIHHLINEEYKNIKKYRN